MNEHAQETRWIESEWLSTTGQQDVDEDDGGGFDRWFADPDPWETFQLDFEGGRSIVVKGHKAELGQTLHSTGLTIWRAARILSDWLVSNRRIVENKTVLELGAGLGVCGLTAHCILGARYTVLSDGDTDTLANLRANVSHNTQQSETLQVRQLVWGDTAHVECIRRQLQQTTKGETHFDVILGSDIIYVDSVIEPLMETVAALLDKSGVFILAYARRNVPVELVLEAAAARGFIWETPKATDGVYVFQRRS